MYLIFLQIKIFTNRLIIFAIFLTHNYTYNMYMYVSIPSSFFHGEKYILIRKNVTKDFSSTRIFFESPIQ